MVASSQSASSGCERAGMYIKVRVVPGAKRESVEQTAPDSFRIAVRAPAERGLANERVLEIIRTHFPEAKRVRLVSGHTSPSKIVSLE